MQTKAHQGRYFTILCPQVTSLRNGRVQSCIMPFGPAFTMKSLFILSKLPCTRMIPAVRCTCKALLLFGGSDSGGEVLKIVGLTDPDTLNMLQTYNQKGNIQSSTLPVLNHRPIQPICSWIPKKNQFKSKASTSGPKLLNS